LGFFFGFEHCSDPFYHPGAHCLGLLARARTVFHSNFFGFGFRMGGSRKIMPGRFRVGKESRVFTLLCEVPARILKASLTEPTGVHLTESWWIDLFGRGGITKKIRVGRDKIVQTHQIEAEKGTACIRAKADEKPPNSNH
jgi:hypothetical protein